MNPDPFKLPFDTISERNGVKLQCLGEGQRVLVVIPGLEGSGESCLHVVAPAIEQCAELDIPVQLCLVNYAGETHDSLEALADTIEKLLIEAYGNRDLLLFSQSFGNLITARLDNSGRLFFEKALMVSPFKKLPDVLARIAHYSLYVTPTWLYRATIQPLGRYVFGPTGNNRKHPFFSALAKATSSGVRRQTKWLTDLDYSDLFSTLQVPCTIVLGEKDRLVNIEDEISFFQTICSESNDRRLVLNENNGHVILIENEIKWAQREMVDYLFN